MKITIKEDGSLKIDGESNTIIYAKSDSGMVLKQQGNNAHFFTDFIKIDGDNANHQHEIMNFIFQSKSDTFTFGCEVTIEGDLFKYIGMQDNSRLFWNIDKNRIEFGYTQEEANKLKPIKVRRRLFNWL